MKDPWKRSVKSSIDSGTIPQQMNLTFSYPKASPETIAKWDKEDRAWWGKHTFKIVIAASIIQVLMLGLMGATMFLIQMGVK